MIGGSDVECCLSTPIFVEKLFYMRERERDIVSQKGLLPQKKVARKTERETINSLSFMNDDRGTKVRQLLLHNNDMWYVEIKQMPKGGRN